MRTAIMLSPFLFLPGCLILWYSIDGLRYAMTEAPTADRTGDLWSAGLATVIGLVLVGFPIRWFWVAARGKHDDPPGE
jgi:hypothetical protein